jgi:hypothetical protein
MARHYNEVGTPYTHDSDGNEVQKITVDTVANGVVVAVTSTAKTIEFLESTVYYFQPDADVYYTISRKVEGEDVTAATANTTSGFPYLRADAEKPLKREKGDKMSVITASTANLEIIPAVR